MIDIHCHILPGLDDGASNFIEALEMIKTAEREGISHIVATPHCIDNFNEDVFSMLTNLKEVAASQGCNIELLAGSEIYITPALLQMVKEKKVICLNNSKYILVELPMYDMPLYTLDVLYELRLIGIVPIIAHPERYKYVISNPSIIKDLIDAGALCQVNSGSITGRYGKAIEKTVHILFKHNMVHFVASDAHSSERRPPKLKKAYDIIKQRYGWDMAYKLFYVDPYSVINNVNITIEDPVTIKKRKWFFFK